MAAALEQSQVAHYLVSLGLVKAAAVLAENLSVVDVSRRNTVYLARSAGCADLVIKQGNASLAHEADVLRALAGEPFVPEVVHFGAGRLVLRSPEGGTVFGDRSPARALGRTLARLHALPVTPIEPDGERLWGLSLLEPPPELLRTRSAGALDVIARIQGDDELCARLLALRPERSALVHGDLRWDNVLALPRRVLLIDWELAGPGDPAADLGFVLAEYLRVWVSSIPIADPDDPARLMAHATRPLPRVRVAMRSLWDAYTPAVAPARVTEFAAVRLLQAAIEHAQGMHRATAHVVTLVQVAESMLRAPEVATAVIMGLRT